MVKMLSTAKLIKGFRIVVDDSRTHSICLDLSPDEGGEDMGPSAHELCVMSYAGCIVAIYGIIARNSKIALKDMEVNVEAIKSEEEGTITETTSRIKIKSNAPEDKLRRIADMAVRTCPVGKLFHKANVKTSYTVTIEKE